MADPYYHVADLLLEIEAEMRRIQLWESEAPPAEDLESLQPFCYDTLEFHQWIQWVMIPRMKEILEAGMPLPSSSDIHPLAEYQFANLEQQTDNLTELLAQFDRIITHYA